MSRRQPGHPWGEKRKRKPSKREAIEVRPKTKRALAELENVFDLASLRATKGGSAER